ncbi:MAG: C4-type zinc ribbon domain-containing protein [Bacteroidota bacterium]|nr:C4-type zinc ribbon domain-containing protein [Bacteroidota bacterium]MDP4234763.1 C4-type zinc ribbon domain-containing protein [Bacteroidota bacterium]MDP4244154.1 C4-type zinc ribbon domain-containing protein [Bacteroidota bacterium]MDP4289316.1 C4-type zinc ribbon domain-containing protein [Bacteroidota bacterium]
MNQSLLHLYELQRVDSKLDELVESRGELPERVQEMRRTLDEQVDQLAQVRMDIADLDVRSKQLSDETVDLREKVERYKAQQFDVKTTREYDAITFQLEDGQRRLHGNVENIGRMGIELEQLRTDEQQMAQDLSDMQRELQEAETALSEVLADTEEEEKQLLARREGLVKQIQSFHLTIYNRVRPAKAGIAVVAIKNGVCGGCFNAIPRQLALELKKAEKHTVCEYCGRIVVGEPIAIAIDGEPQPVTYEVEGEEGDE